MLQRALLLLAGLLAMASPALSQGEPLHLDLNIPALKLVVYQGDTVLRTYPVSVGMKDHDTPTGDFKISRAEWNPWWRPPARDWAKDDKVTPPGPSNPMGRVKLFFMPYYFIHGTPDEASMGTPASHGCVRMLNRDVIALARLIHEREAPQVTSKDIDRILTLRGPNSTREVPFKKGVSLTIRYDPIVVEGDRVRVYPDYYGYHAVHAEAVYQALISAGYDVSQVSREDVGRLVKRAKTAKTSFSVPLAEAFGSGLAKAKGSAPAGTR